MEEFEAAVRASFAGDYADARARFRAAATGTPIRSYDNPNKGPRGEALATDAAWFGAPDAPAVMVLVSATHGVEGFTGSGCQVDWLRNGGPARLPNGVAALLIHAINPYGFAWLRRVTEENVDLNRNFVDFSDPLPENPGHDELADAFVPAALDGPVFEAAERKIADYRARNGEKALQIARGGGQYRHPRSVFYGGSGPTWSRRTLERIVADYDLPSRRVVGTIDYHTGLGPFGYGEPIMGQLPGTIGITRGKRWWGDSATEPALGTSSSVIKVGLSEFGWTRLLGDKVSCAALEYGTYTQEEGRRALREDHWLHNSRNQIDWDDPEVRRIKAQIRKQYFPDTEDWKEMVLFRSRQVISQTIAGLVAE
jgi:hypothetical protein